MQELVRASVEETLNAMLDAEADAQCGAKRYERSPERLDTRAGHYERKLLTPSGEVSLQVPRLAVGRRRRQHITWLKNGHVASGRLRSRSVRYPPQEGEGNRGASIV